MWCACACVRACACACVCMRVCVCVCVCVWSYKRSKSVVVVAVRSGDDTSVCTISAHIHRNINTSMGTSSFCFFSEHRDMTDTHDTTHI